MSSSFPPPPPPTDPPSVAYEPIPPFLNYETIVKNGYFITVVKNGYRDWRKYSARSSRREYWLWQLHFLLVIMVLSFILGPLPTGLATLLSNVIWIPLVPSIAMWVRRIHDTGHRIWWCFIPLVGLILACSATDTKETRWARTTRS